MLNIKDLIFSNVTFRQSLIMQTVWLAMAVSYNGISILLIRHAYAPLKEGYPEVTLGFLALYAGLILFGFTKLYRLYFCLAILLVIILVVVGIGSHIYTAINTGISDTYSSLLAWVFAILINFYGVIVFLLGILIAQNEIQETK